MRYMLLIYVGRSPDAQMSPEEQGAEMAAYGAFTQEILAQGLMQAGDALQVPSTATSVRVEQGKTVTTDGPFAETKEWLAGYYLIDASDLDQAIAAAAKIPAAAHGTIEVRPVAELPPEYAEMAGA